jgi:hypothetical protein
MRACACIVGVLCVPHTLMCVQRPVQLCTSAGVARRLRQTMGQVVARTQWLLSLSSFVFITEPLKRLFNSSKWQVSCSRKLLTMYMCVTCIYAYVHPLAEFIGFLGDLVLVGCSIHVCGVACWAML